MLILEATVNPSLEAVASEYYGCLVALLSRSVVEASFALGHDLTHARRVR